MQLPQLHRLHLTSSHFEEIKSFLGSHYQEMKTSTQYICVANFFSFRLASQKIVVENLFEVYDFPTATRPTSTSVRKI